LLPSRYAAMTPTFYAVLDARLPAAAVELWDLWCTERGADGSQWPDVATETVQVLHFFAAIPPDSAAWPAAFRARFPEAIPAGLDAPQVSWSLKPREAWDTEWQRHFSPLPVGERFLICPPWDDGSNPATWAGGNVPEGAARSTDPERLRLVIDPGQGFGTGRHATTALTLGLIARLLSSGAPPGRMLDVGTGSGILLLAALMLGVPEGWALDIDPCVAPEVRHNLALNRLLQPVHLAIGTPAVLRDAFPLVTANLTAPVLTAHAADLTRLTSPGGHLIVSGILVSEADAVLAQWPAPVWQVLERAEAEGWCAASLVRVAP
jgi:ribosomal protein L11 methyltransferase